MSFTRPQFEIILEAVKQVKSGVTMKNISKTLKNKVFDEVERQAKNRNIRFKTVPTMRLDKDQKSVDNGTALLSITFTDDSNVKQRWGAHVDFESDRILGCHKE